VTEEDKPVQFPQYQPPTGPQLADRKQQAPLVKLMTRMLPKKIKPRLLGKPKGIQSDQNVHVKHKKVRFY
jgi:hypothetical protein